eukprot:scpid110722/ scgid16992/ 
MLPVIMTSSCVQSLQWCMLPVCMTSSGMQCTSGVCCWLLAHHLHWNDTFCTVCCYKQIVTRKLVNSITMSVHAACASDEVELEPHCAQAVLILPIQHLVRLFCIVPCSLT